MPRRHDPNTARQEGKQTLLRNVEEPFRRKARPELLEGERQRAGARGLNLDEAQGKLSALRVDVRCAASEHEKTFFECKENAAVVAREDLDMKRGATLFIIQRKKAVPGRSRPPEARNLAPHPETRHSAL